MSRWGKRPGVEEGDALEEYEIEDMGGVEYPEAEFRRFMEGAIQEAGLEAQKIALDQTREELSDQGCFHQQEWTDAVKQEFYRSLEVCLSAFKESFMEELFQQIEGWEVAGAEDLEEDVPSEPPLNLQLCAHLNIMNLSQVQAAAALGVSKMTLSQWLKDPGEKGWRRIPKKHEARVRAWVGAE